MNAKIIGVIVLLVILLIFAIQNTQSVQINFLFWGFQTTAVLSILVSFVIGFLLGWLILWMGPKKKKSPPSSLP